MIEIKAHSVPEFMRAILPTEPHFAHRPTLFRGQADADWGLVPSLWRASSWLPVGGAERYGLRVVGDLVADGAHSVVERGQASLIALKNIVHRRGLHPSPIGDDQLEALAQHLGLPTRLLDWTLSPLFAAYFAAADALRLPLRGNDLVVYSMSQLFAQNSRLLEKLDKPDVGGFGNPNLVAQQGRFIRVDCLPPDLLARVTRRTTQAGEVLGRQDRVLVDNHLAVVRLPHACAADLIRVLRDQGIHAASMFPGHAGASEIVRELFRSETFESI